MKDFYIVDTTLRDGEQTAGIVFLEEEKIEIAKKLDEAGVDYIEAGIPAMGIEEQNCMKKIMALGLNAKIISWNRLKLKDINDSLKCGVKDIHISVPGSELHIYKKLKKDYHWVIDELETCIQYALGKNVTVSIGIEDASRSNLDFLRQILNRAEKFGVKRVRYSDTVGALDPIQSFEVVKKIKKYFKGDIDFHAHNDFGMATANTLCAYRAGARYISCCVNGLGERAGNTSLEEIVMALKYITSCHTDFKISKLVELSTLVQKNSGESVHDRKPIVGKRVFSHESGIHVDGLIKDPDTYEVFRPEEIGRKREIVIGKFSGVSSIMNKLLQMGIHINKKEANHILKLLRNEYIHNKHIDVESFLNRQVMVKSSKSI